MQARIYQRPKNAMQSGKALIDQWILEFAPAEAKKPDPLMGWAGSGDTREQVRLKFATVEAANMYSRTRFQPMNQATNSPRVPYEYEYALPETGSIAANSA